MTRELSGLRREYDFSALEDDLVLPSPFLQFHHWFDEVQQADFVEPNAVALATATMDGRPSARMVLLKEYGEHGFFFCSRYDSRKGDELAVNPHAAMVFYWDKLERQVRIEGTVLVASAEKSDELFLRRPEGARLAATVSAQSRPVSSRAQLEREYAALAATGREIRRPDEWGAYVLAPLRFEFWQGRRNRLHDRIVYERELGQDWRRFRLYP